ncbi:MAG: tRNA (adenosine(37)-N6)-threonylcarbamoyltransferase complex transferase subunit TsaD, partial [Clostridiales bacterium]|nr:tRNA (adenosine(37)-N6)-threonylcarbamoyltransferase complex transferase subunit TsaD [Clostridiales bacterium]
MKDAASKLKNKKDVFILGLETSCDETSAAVVRNGREVLSNIIASQIETHKVYGGVVPEIASRKHVEVINNVIHHALEKSGIQKEQLDGIAVTYGPGLVGALLVGLSVAKALAFGLSVPLI